jgi:hypothetical protein
MPGFAMTERGRVFVCQPCRQYIILYTVSETSPYLALFSQVMKNSHAFQKPAVDGRRGGASSGVYRQRRIDDQSRRSVASHYNKRSQSPPFARLSVSDVEGSSPEMGRYAGGRPNGPAAGKLKKRDRRPAWCGRRTVANNQDTHRERQDFGSQN